MRLSQYIAASIIVSGLATALPVEKGKRAVQYVTLIETVDAPEPTDAAPVADPNQANLGFSAAPAPPPGLPATTAAAAAPVAVAAAANNQFSTAPVPLAGTPATTAAAGPAVVAPTAAAVAQAAAPASTSSSGAFSFKGLFDFLFGSGGLSTTTTSTANSAPVAGAVGSSVASGGSASQSSSSGLYGSTSSSSASSGSGGTSNYGNAAAGAAAAAGSKGITYSPYTESNACKTAEEVSYDIGRLGGYDLIRLYSTDCSGIENVLASITSSQKLFLGIWNIDTASVQGGLTDILNAISSSSRGWSAVDTISIGNEQVNAGTASVAQVSAGVSAARQWLKQNAPSYGGSVVTVDTLVAVVNNPGLCSISDYLAVNCHPYWDGGVQPSNAGPWLQQQIANLKSTCGNGKSVLITETGWPTKGQTYGQCVPSVANQVAALKSLVGALGSQIIAFTMYNDYWKAPGSYGVEQYWGIFGDPSA